MVASCHPRAPDTDEIDASKLFERVEIRRVGWESSYTAEEYERLLMTYSGHRALERLDREVSSTASFS